MDLREIRELNVLLSKYPKAVRVEINKQLMEPEIVHHEKRNPGKGDPYVMFAMAVIIGPRSRWNISWMSSGIDAKRLFGVPCENMVELIKNPAMVFHTAGDFNRMIIKAMQASNRTYRACVQMRNIERGLFPAKVSATIEEDSVRFEMRVEDLNSL